MGMTITEKILSKASGSKVSPGDIVVADIDVAMAHDGTAPLTINAFQEMGGEKVWDPKKIILIIDHVVPSASEGTSELHGMMREFATKQKLKHFYYGEGVCHQLLPERGHVKPGALIVGADSHTCTHGALGAFSTGIGSTEMAAVLVSGKLWFKVPETLKFNVEGNLPAGVLPKDVALHIVGEMKSSGATYKAVEFSGPTVKDMSVAGRMTLCNMAVEMGAKTGIVEPDSKVVNYLKNRVEGEVELTTNDRGAEYEETLEFEVGSLEPQVACPHLVDNVKPVSEVGKIEVNQVFLGSCTNGRLEDLESAGAVLKGKRIAPGTRMIVTPASKEIYKKALQKGLINIFMEAGCTVCNPGCGPCAGAHQGILAPGEVCISTSNRNFLGRMGSPEAEIYLASPLTAAASAVTGRITDPRTIGGIS
jgi:3-isopropylmalate/(R)-2-methylmalate dehydratase large subunit